MVCAQRTHEVLVGTATDAGDLCTEVTRELYRSRADAAGGAHDQHLFTGTDTRAVTEKVERRGGTIDERRGLLVRETRRHEGDRGVCREAAQLRVGADCKPGEAEHAIARTEARDTASHLFDLAGKLDAHHAVTLAGLPEAKHDAGHHRVSAPHHSARSRHGRGMDADSHPVVAGLRDRLMTQGKHVGGTIRRAYNRPHLPGRAVKRRGRRGKMFHGIAAILARARPRPKLQIRECRTRFRDPSPGVRARARVIARAGMGRRAYTGCKWQGQAPQSTRAVGSEPREGFAQSVACSGRGAAHRHFDLTPCARMSTSCSMRLAMRILFVAPNILLPGANGGSTHVTEVVAALREHHDVLVLARRGSTAPGSVEVGGKLAPGPLRYLLPLLQLPTALAAARAFRPDAIYERFSAFGLGPILGKRLGVPVVSMVLDRSATLTTYAGADRLITTAPHLVPDRYRHKVRRVTWGANVDRFHPSIPGAPMRTTLGLRHDDFVIGYAGAFYAWHGLDDLVEVIASLHRDPRAARFKVMLVGDGSTKPEVEALVRQRGLEDRFIFTGRVPYEDVPRYLAACDVCTALYDPSRHPELRRDGMFFDPLKVFESLAMGKPTLTLDSANMRMLFEHETHALLLPPGARGPQAQALLRLAEDPALRERLAQQGRALVCERYSWTAHATELTHLFQDLLDRTSDHAPRD